MAEPYTYTDADGDALEIWADKRRTAFQVRQNAGSRPMVYIEPDRRAEVAAALWPEGQGPIILDRVAVNPRTGYHQAGWSVALRDDGNVYVATNRDFAPDDALELAAVVAAFAQHAQWGPDPAEVTRVARLLHKDVCGGGEDGEDPARLCDCWPYAAAAVRAMAVERAL